MSGTALNNSDRQERLFLYALVAYFGLQVFTRCCVSNSLQLDEAEQLLLTQTWQWGYGSQPPLYTWLQTICFALFERDVFALSILKNCLLFSIYWFVYLSGKEVFSNR